MDFSDIGIGMDIFENIGIGIGIGINLRLGIGIWYQDWYDFWVLVYGIGICMDLGYWYRYESL